MEELLRRLSDLPAEIRATVRDNGGGHANHQFFWKILGPNPNAAAAAKPAGKLAQGIARDFGTLDSFKQAFSAAAAGVFGSGWAFLVVDPREDGRLKIHTTSNQDSVLLEGLPGLLACDIWEHAYYLRYRNRRADYLDAFWHVVDWQVVSRRYDNFLSGKQQL